MRRVAARSEFLEHALKQKRNCKKSSIFSDLQIMLHHFTTNEMEARKKMFLFSWQWKHDPVWKSINYLCGNNVGIFVRVKVGLFSPLKNRLFYISPFLSISNQTQLIRNYNRLCKRLAVFFMAQRSVGHFFFTWVTALATEQFPNFTASKP